MKSDDATLPPGTLVGEFRIHSLIGRGGFGIVYLAHDESLDRLVAVKEYMPSDLAQRENITAVVVRSQRHGDTFATGLRSFINEARLLAQFDHPSLVKVYRFFTANGTAYMVMPYYNGITLMQMLRSREAPVEELWLRRILLQLLDALEIIHAANCYHRDISADNILMLAESRPLLLDFGAARRVIEDMTRGLTVILRPGFAPIEQYDAQMEQGPWTDLYALAAVAHLAITGEPPAPAPGRAMSDRLLPLTQRVAGRYRASFLQALDAALSLDPRQRPQSEGDFRRMLEASDPSATMSDAVTARPQATVQPQTESSSESGAEIPLGLKARGADKPMLRLRSILTTPTQTRAHAARQVWRERLPRSSAVAAAVAAIAVITWVGFRTSDNEDPGRITAQPQSEAPAKPHSAEPKTTPP